MSSFEEAGSRQPHTSEQAETQEAHYSQLVERLHRGERAAIDELYNMVSRGLKFLIRRQLQPQDVDDTVHDTILAVVRGIQINGLRNPDCLIGYVRTIMKRQIACRVNRLSARSRDVNIDSIPEAVDANTPEQQLIHAQSMTIMQKVLRSLPARYREVLTRFYVLEQPAEQVMEEMGLTPTQFRLIKSRAKAQFAKRGQRSFRSTAVLATWARRRSPSATAAYTPDRATCPRVRS